MTKTKTSSNVFRIENSWLWQTCFKIINSGLATLSTATTAYHSSIQMFQLISDSSACVCCLTHCTCVQVHGDLSTRAIPRSKSRRPSAVYCRRIYTPDIMFAVCKSQIRSAFNLGTLHAWIAVFPVLSITGF